LADSAVPFYHKRGRGDMVAERWETEDLDALVLEQCATVLDRLYERIAHRFEGFTRQLPAAPRNR